ncbi:DedA family protein [Streptomyces fuscigenes]|uniref:DedA family protein n=1 Tax=Streptomyces fuscigenes TaxID=1528880 RepID=UPI001F243A08|nr:DedA family protein [Streptomyces fuscigenes]MCF3962227.1 VTT domain-containing protein [Streptomyces fuscigenes]
MLLTAAPPDLPGFLGSIAPVLDHWGYLAVGGLLFLEDFGIPVPGETILIASAVYAGAGRLNMATVVVIAVVAAVLGDNVGYAIGRYGGHRLVDRYGKYVLLTPERVRKAEDFFTRHGGKIVTVARFVDGLRQANGIIAGMTLMPWPRFLLFNTLGAVLWVGTWATVGYFAGQHLDTIYPQIQRYELIFACLIVALIVFMVLRRLRRRRRERREAASSGHHDDPRGATAEDSADDTPDAADGQDVPDTRNATGSDGTPGADDSRGARDPGHAPPGDAPDAARTAAGAPGSTRAPDEPVGDGPGSERHGGGPDDPDDPDGARDMGGRSR